MWKKIISILALTLTVWVILNFDFFRKNLEYELKKDNYQNTPAPSAEKMEPDKLLIPSLNIEAPIKYGEEINEDRFQELLREGAVHYPGTALPGAAGNVYIFGHSSDSPWSPGRYKIIFALLPRVQKGAEVYISDNDGNKYIYKVLEEGRAVGKNDLSVLEQDRSKKLLTLQTSYPVGTSLKRYVVVAEFVPQ